MEEQDHTTSPHNRHSAKSPPQKVVKSATTPNLQGQLFDEFGNVPYTGVPIPTKVIIPISEDDSKNIEVVIADVEVNADNTAAILNNTFFQSLIVTFKI